MYTLYNVQSINVQLILVRNFERVNNDNLLTLIILIKQANEPAITAGK